MKARGVGKKGTMSGRCGSSGCKRMGREKLLLWNTKI